ncbi:MAG: hypothetical protein AAF560_03950, partial [Acidobacteriota bacterium]
LDPGFLALNIPGASFAPGMLEAKIPGASLALGMLTLQTAVSNFEVGRPSQTKPLCSILVCPAIESCASERAPMAIREHLMALVN